MMSSRTRAGSTVCARDIDFVTKSILCAPMRQGDRIVGVMQVLNKRSGEPFTDQDLRLLTTLAIQAAVAGGERAAGAQPEGET